MPALLKSDKYGPPSQRGPEAVLETDKKANDDGQVWVKNTENTQHELFLTVMDGKLGLAPVTEPRRVLDIATGTGIWAMQY
ncbi:hypothetical protein E4U53_005689, partial [Claviceps sorghi]